MKFIKYIAVLAFSILTACGGGQEETRDGQETAGSLPESAFSEELLSMQSAFEITPSTDRMLRATANLLSYSALNNLADYNMIVLYGQSNAAGIDAIRKTNSEYIQDRAFRFKRGIHTWDILDNAATPSLRSNSDFELVPLSQPYLGGYSIYETMAHGMAAYLMANTDDSHKFIFSYAGEGGRFLRELDKRNNLAVNPLNGTRTSPGGYYDTMIDDIARAKSLADSEGKTFRVLAMVWVQGEAENQYRLIRYENPVSRADFLEAYKNDLINLKDDFHADVMALTGSLVPPLFFSYQTVGARSGQAQLNAHYASPDIFLVSTTYMFDTANSTYVINPSTGQRKYGDVVHWTADGQRWMGAQMAKSLLDRLQQGSGNAVYPVHLQKIKKDKGNVYRIKFHTPKPPLVLDYDSLPKNIGSYGAMTNHSGFIVANESYRVPITSVKVISDDTVEIETAEVVPENQGFHVSYIDMRNYPYFESPLLNKTIQQYTESVVDSGISFEIKVDGILNPIPTGSSVRTFYCQTTSAIFHIDNIRHDVSTNSTFLSGDFRKNISDLPLDRNYAGQKFSVGCGRNLFTGNLRDSDDREPIYSAINFYGQEKKQKLHNWALSFSWPLDSTLANKLLLRRQEITSNVGLQASTQR